MTKRIEAFTLPVAVAMDWERAEEGGIERKSFERRARKVAETLRSDVHEDEIERAWKVLSQGR